MYQYQAEVVAVHDGDTMRFDVDLGFSAWLHSLDVRLQGIDTPELGRPDRLGEQAHEFTANWFLKHPGPYLLTTIKDRQEKYGRYLATVRAPDMNELIIDLLASGLAKPYSGRGPHPTWP